MTFEEQFPSLNHLGKNHYLFDSELEMSGISRAAIMDNCIDKKHAEKAIKKLEQAKGSGLFSDRNWPDILRSELGLKHTEKEWRPTRLIG